MLKTTSSNKGKYGVAWICLSFITRMPVIIIAEDTDLVNFGKCFWTPTYKPSSSSLQYKKSPKQLTAGVLKQTNKQDQNHTKG